MAFEKLQKLTLAQVKEQARKAYYHGALTAQDPNPGSRSAVYVKRGSDGKMRYCAIGCALDEVGLDNVVKAKFISYTSVRTLAGRCIDVPFAEIEAMAEIQSTHDNWAQASDDVQRYGPGAGLTHRQRMENIFRSLIDLPSLHSGTGALDAD